MNCYSFNSSFNGYQMPEINIISCFHWNKWIRTLQTTRTKKKNTNIFSGKEWRIENGIMDQIRYISFGMTNSEFYDCHFAFTSFLQLLKTKKMVLDCTVLFSKSCTTTYFTSRRNKYIYFYFSHIIIIIVIWIC